ncbi:hypothetical protein [Algivirga pacifica]|uniref:Lipoprotein n=1 Tax=Algivirga pacifica TaxID=1162670 RepID=A0ABP9DL28_9BACT
MNKYVVIILFFGLIGCTERPESYREWVIENYTESVQTKTLEVQALYRPPIYLALEEVDFQVSDKELLMRRTEELKNTVAFTMEVSSLDQSDWVVKGATSQTEKEQRLYYLSYQLINDIHLLVNGKVYPCDFLHFERTYNLKKGSRKFILVFEIDSELKVEDKVKLSLRSDLLSRKGVDLQYQIKETQELEL